MGEVFKLIPPPKNYFCTHCGKNVTWDEIVEGFCPWCREQRLIHKACGGRVVEQDLNPIYY